MAAKSQLSGVVALNLIYQDPDLERTTYLTLAFPTKKRIVRSVCQTGLADNPF